MCLFCCGRSIVFRSVLVPCVTLRQIGVSSRMHPSLQQSEVPPFLRFQLRWGRESLPCRRHAIQVSATIRRFLSWDPYRFHPHNAPFQSKMRRLRSLRGDAHLRRWLTACQPVPVFLLPIMCFVGLVVSPICCPFGATQHLQTNTCRIGSLPCLPQST